MGNRRPVPLIVPKGGLCQDTEDLTPWLDPPQQRATRNKIKACDGCPALDSCRAYAAQLTWHPGIVVAGWTAVTRLNGKFLGVDPVYPPWASKEDKQWVSQTA